MPSSKVKKILKRAKGFYGRGKNVFRIAAPRVQKAMSNAYISRKLLKRDVRKTWIQQINAASRAYGVPYSSLIRNLQDSKIELNRKMLAELSHTEPLTFQAIIAHSSGPDAVESALPKSVFQHASKHGLVSTTSYIPVDLHLPEEVDIEDSKMTKVLQDLYSSSFDEHQVPINK